MKHIFAYSALVSFSFLSLTGCGLMHDSTPLSPKEACTEMWKFGKCLNASQGQIQVIRLTDIIKLDYENNTIISKGYARIDDNNTNYYWNSPTPPTLTLIAKNPEVIKDCKPKLAEREYPIQIIAQGEFKGSGKFDINNIIACDASNIVEPSTPLAPVPMPNAASSPATSPAALMPTIAPQTQPAAAPLPPAAVNPGASVIVVPPSGYYPATTPTKAP